MTETTPKKKVVILDDDKFLLTMYSKKFLEAGLEVETVETGEELLNHLKAGAAPDLVLLDIIVPGLSGLEALEMIRKDNLIPAAKIIMLSNESDEAEIERANNLHVQGYIVKALATPSEVIEKSLKALSA